MTVALARYKALGFTLINGIGEGGLRSYPVAASIKIEAGHAVHDNGSGYATDATTAFSSLFLGIAAAEADNSAVATDGAIQVLVIPPLSKYQFIVPVGNTTKIAVTDIGTCCDLEAAGTIDTTDASIASGPSFKIDAIDVSADAIVGNAYGYAIGHFDFIS